VAGIDSLGGAPQHPQYVGHQAQVVRLAERVTQAVAQRGRVIERAHRGVGQPTQMAADRVLLEPYHPLLVGDLVCVTQRQRVQVGGFAVGAQR
jgi:hypothetical protein